MLTKQMQT